MNTPISLISAFLRGIFAVTMARIGRADRHAERVAGDEHAGGGNRYGEIAGDIGQKAHDDEFGRADAERGNGESEKGQGHGGSGGGAGVSSQRAFSE